MNSISFYEEKNDPAVFTVNENLLDLPHIHNEIELIYIKEGETTAFADKKSYLMHSGDLFVCFPNQIHYYTPSSDGVYYVAIMSAQSLPALQDLFIKNNPKSNVIHIEKNSVTEGIIETIYNKYDEKKPNSVTWLIGYLNILFFEIIPELELESITPYNTTLIKKIIQYCTENYMEPLSLDMLSKELHINKYHISHLFHDKMNMCFNNFINTIRVNSACDLLKDKQYNITEISQMSGFGTSRTFNTAFLKTMNQTPKEYRSKYISSHT